MTSNELNEIFNKTRRTPNISLTPKQVEELVKDLDELEEYRKIIGTPIQEIMKRLKILEILKYHIGYNYELNCLISNLEYRNEAEENDVREWLYGKD